MTKDKKRLAFIVLIYVALFGIFYITKSNSENSPKYQFANTLDEQNEYIPLEEENNISESEEIFIHISGEINYPGLIKLNKGQRLYEAIEIAGGMTENADINQINLSVVLNDQDKVYIPSIDENVSFIQSDMPEIININTATKDQLMTLNGVGDKTADSIIEYREENRFNKIEDLLNVPGIGEQKFNQIKDKINI